MKKVLGIYRELQNSPRRENDDALILRAVARELGALGQPMDLATPEEADGLSLGTWDAVLPMCESYPRLVGLIDAERSRAARFINSPRSVLGCYRIRMIESFKSAPEVLLPPTEVRRVISQTPLTAPSFDIGSGLWVKRGDVHNTCLSDVVFARDWAAVEAIREDFERREIQDLVLQTHVDGDLIKFYGVGPGAWFTWFYHDPETARRFPFELAALAAQAAAGARATGLEVFGGDAIVTPESKIHLIDINSWPSFARVRGEAAGHIARHVARVLAAPAVSEAS